MIKEHYLEYLPKDAKAEFHGNSAVFEVPASKIKEIAVDLFAGKNLQLKIITATDERKENGCFKIWYVFGVPKKNIFIIPFIKIKDTNDFPSLSLEIRQASGYERRIQTFFGLKPVGNPDPRPIILHENWPTDKFPLRKDFDWKTRPVEAQGSYDFQTVKGEGIYEIPVGPIHAGIIEPGHFRFSVAGESIVLLEPRLGFVHKGSEKLFENISLDEKTRLSEKISGDSSFSHSMAFCSVIEQLGNISAPKRAQYLRVICAELERLANHFGDIGAIMMDTGFNFGGAQGSRLREMIMRINERIFGSRFLRGVNIVGGVKKDINNEEKEKLSLELANILKDFSEVIDVAGGSASLLNRLKGTGAISQNVAKDLGIMGVAGKAVGISSDARYDYPYGAYGELALPEIAVESDGDVNARFNVRVKEVRASIDIIQNALLKIPKGDLKNNGEIKLEKNSVVVSIVEGWRGDIVYFVTTDSSGNISRVAPRDPSFVNWNAIKDAGFDNVVPDFPLINKSFNMSYSGNDL
ncbi:MAG: NADH-quinone oxidoreductase subunit C [Candidatus Paceibacterota bacterium]